MYPLPRINKYECFDKLALACFGFFGNRSFDSYVDIPFVSFSKSVLLIPCLKFGTSFSVL